MSTLQLTTSRRGRHFFNYKEVLPCFLQLTTSRRGRRSFGGKANQNGTFNSRPHEEVDRPGLLNCGLYYSFNSRPHEEVDYVVMTLNAYDKPFNSRPHEEVDENKLTGNNVDGFLQLTTSRRGRRCAVCCAVD